MSLGAKHEAQGLKLMAGEGFCKGSQGARYACHERNEEGRRLRGNSGWRLHLMGNAWGQEVRKVKKGGAVWSKSEVI
jgi:hypothetical protein